MSEERHEYDGIVELDNQLPRWWVWLFVITAIFGMAYATHYMIGGGKDPIQDYTEAVREVELLALINKKPDPEPTSAELVAIVTDTNVLSMGQKHFREKCVSCHGAAGQGGIGPNLTDDHWIHGGTILNIYRVIRAGVLEKGMPPWGDLLKPEELRAVTAFVRTLRGTKPSGGKGPQGEVFSGND